MFSPILATGLAGFLVQVGLRTPRKYSWLLVTAGLAILAAICYWLFDLARIGGLVAVFELFTGLLCAGIAVVCGLWMLLTLKAWRKLAALVFGIAFPLLAWFCFWAGNTQTPKNITQRNGDEIVRRLYQYRASVGRFPQHLADLEPTTLKAIPESLTTQGTGWMYESAVDHFTLGYWYGPEKMGASVCLYRSNSHKPQWDCDFNHWGPFVGVPTPMAMP